MASQAVTLGVIERLKVIFVMQHKCQPNAPPNNKSHCMCVSISILPCHSLPQKQGSHSSSTTHSLLGLVTEHAHKHGRFAIIVPAHARVAPMCHLSLLQHTVTVYSTHNTTDTAGASLTHGLCSG